MEDQTAIKNHEAYASHETQLTTKGLANPPPGPSPEPSTDVVISKTYVVPPGLRLFRGKLVPFPTGNSLHDNTVHVPDLSTLQVVHVATSEEKAPGGEDGQGEIKKVRKVLPADVKPHKLGRYSKDEFEALTSPKEKKSHGDASAIHEESEAPAQ